MAFPISITKKVDVLHGTAANMLSLQTVVSRRVDKMDGQLRERPSACRAPLFAAPSSTLICRCLIRDKARRPKNVGDADLNCSSSGLLKVVGVATGW